jgi:hypothetical protein
VHLVGFTIEKYHDAQSHEHQRREVWSQTSHINCITHGKNIGTHGTGSWLLSIAGLGYFEEQ